MLLYVSSPITDTPENPYAENIARAKKAGYELYKMGHAPFIPALNTLFAGDPEYSDLEHSLYMDADFRMISRCDALLMLEGWPDSKGCKAEHAFAESIGVPIYYAPDYPPLHPTEVRCPRQVRAFEQTLGKMYRVHLRKNADYSPANILATGGIGTVVRLWDKMARILNLEGFHFDIDPDSVKYVGAKEASNEPLADSYEDMGTYTVIQTLLKNGDWGR